MGMAEYAPTLAMAGVLWLLLLAVTHWRRRRG